MVFAGIDYSYGCPAICVYNSDWGEFTAKNCKFFYLYDKKKYEGDFGILHGFLQAPYKTPEQRFAGICQWSTDILKAAGVRYVTLEGYALGSRAGLIFQIAENTSLLKNWMWKNGIQFDTPAPTTVKKFFTGKGNSKKDAMGQAFIEKTGLPLHDLVGAKTIDSKPVQDCVDAFALCSMAVEKYSK